MMIFNSHQFEGLGVALCEVDIEGEPLGDIEDEREMLGDMLLLGLGLGEVEGLPDGLLLVLGVGELRVRRFRLERLREKVRCLDL